ncbi:MAG: hypothetical protein HOH43_18980 [Candidatus Latescibacteria bacterium]|nr:hypothetical protein [Candidatus Latescibacterota bacterium]
MKDDLKNLLFDYVNGELEDGDALKVERRSLEDPDFARELELTRATVTLLAAYRPDEAMPDFWNRLSRRIEVDETPWQAWIWVSKRLIPSLVAATLLVSGVLYYQNSKNSDLEEGVDILAVNQQDDWLSQTGEISKESLLESVVLFDGTVED